ncbi:putative phage protein (TIGR02218 family) [Rhizomicrobium palustre]|uniref:Putative phage protein (TIGR02218 family) n=1 Tax=Rhizomicrobium palustre TaxID=189966 RepID=A0A846MVP6_9PROT|nr:DUF2163 domain-containing protein [Rhizomicrobium palustre]NIK87628.1 putative phage protein (TIGR02218 family) [Rhizomicrobium palustre]
MKSLQPALAAHLASGTTTLCWCWKITRGDGAVLGFTDHDQPLSVAGITFEAATGFTASEVQSGLDLSIDNLTVEGALSSDSINEADLAAGLFDCAAIEIWRVNWADASQRVLMRKGTLGEVKRGKTGFSAEMRGLTAALNQPVGRAFGHSCDAMLGDARCKVALTPITGSVTTVTDTRRFSVSGLSGCAAGWFAEGVLHFTSGANVGRSALVKRHALAGSAVTLELWQAMSKPIAPSDAFTLTPGCDKQFATCQTKFANVVNFRGHPYMPGTAAALAGVSKPLDGKSRYGH